MSFFEIDSRFLIDTAFHRLEIIRDDGLYRHLRMQQPGNSCYYYDVITWPGYLTVTGDMGTWTFSRIADMFDFLVPGREESIPITGLKSWKLARVVRRAKCWRKSMTTTRSAKA